MKNLICFVFILFSLHAFCQQNKKVNVVKPTALSIDMVYIQGGLFQMGCSYEEKNEKPVHLVKLSDFYIGKYEVTQKQWKSLMGYQYAKIQGDNLPVTFVNWNDVNKFLSKLNAKTGKNYRLPTEAEWEYAARGGNKSRFYKFAGSNNLDKVAWYLWNCFDNSGIGKIHAVGSKQPNELGIYDMTGNVWEMCSDWYAADYYSKSPQNNPKGSSFGKEHVFRGGGWMDTLQSCRSTKRMSYRLDWATPTIGFRVVVSK